ncbi:MAG TPA: discoidin domain-containing protein [Polyangiaceae bacterium]|nr:discoidin domain-containing protein [Polyangiaceae bacterium]
MAATPLFLLTLGSGCAEGTQESELNSNTLMEGGTAVAGTAAGGSRAGADATGAVPTAGDTATPAAGTSSAGAAGSELTAGSGGSGVAIGGTAGVAAVAGGGGLAGSAGASGSGGNGGSGGAVAGAGGAAGAGGGGMAGAGGSAPTGFRYVRLVATSEQAGAVWSSVAELQVFTTGDSMLARAGWVATADSQETVDENAPASAAIDGDPATFWHTEWAPAPNDVNDPKLPHQLVIDMSSAHAVTGFSYLPRQTGTHGRIKDWQFFVSKDGQNWGSAVKSGTFADGTALQKLSF